MKQIILDTYKDRGWWYGINHLQDMPLLWGNIPSIRCKRI
jgi:hypothetical protein